MLRLLGNVNYLLLDRNSFRDLRGKSVGQGSHGGQKGRQIASERGRLWQGVNDAVNVWPREPRASANLYGVHSWGAGDSRSDRGRNATNPESTSAILFARADITLAAS
jgi:hypothetical protein